MENNYNRKNQNLVVPHSPRLLRSKSGAPNISTLSSSPRDIPPLTPNSHIHRSKSTTKSRINKEQENIFRVLGQYNRNKNAVKPVEIAKPSRKTRSATTSPSAWALSPGRSPTVEPLRSSSGGAKVANSGGGAKMVKSSGGVGRVLKYFRSNKVCTVEEEAFHRYRILHTRLVQWRVVNARAETVMATKNSVARRKLHNVWLRNYQMRKAVTEKRIQLQKCKHEIKLHQIIDPEVGLLNEWTKIEKQNTEAVRKLEKNLLTLSIRLPLVNGAQVDMLSIYKAMCTAMDVMSNIEATICNSYVQVEEASSMLKELTMIIGQEIQGMMELRKTITEVVSLKVQEESLRGHLVQAGNESVLQRLSFLH